MSDREEETVEFAREEGSPEGNPIGAQEVSRSPFVRGEQKEDQGSEGPTETDPTRRTLFEAVQQGRPDSRPGDEEPQVNPGTTRNMSDPSANTGSLATVHADVGDMFETTVQVSEDKLNSGMCAVPRASRGDTPKDEDKMKQRACAPISNVFGLPYYFVSGKYGESEGNGVAGEHNACDVIVSVSYKCVELKERIRQYDMVNAISIPVLKDKTGSTPAERWDFTQPRRNLVDSFLVIDEIDVKLWSQDSLMWGKTKYERMDQEWLLLLSKNACSTDLAMKINTAFSELPGKYQGGVVYLWMVLNTIVRISDDVVKALQAYLKEFREKGLYKFQGENVVSACIEIKAISTRLQEAGELQKDSLDDVIKGLSKCTNPTFSTIFSDFDITQRNSLLTGSTTLKGTTLEKIVMVLNEAEEQYAALALSGDWTAAPSAHMASGPKCDNCGGNHVVRDCKTPRNEQRIEQNRKARQEAWKQARQNDNGGARGGTRGGSKRTDRNGYTRGAFGQGKFKPPKQGEVARKVGNRVYCACKECGWTSGDKAHSSGDHGRYMDNPSSFKMNPRHPYMIKLEAVSGNGGDRGTPRNSSGGEGSTNDSASAGSANFMQLVGQKLGDFETQSGDPNACAWAAHFREFMKSLPKE